MDRSLIYGLMVFPIGLLMFVGLTFVMMGYRGGMAYLKETAGICAGCLMAIVFVVIFTMALPMLWVMEKGDPGNR